MPTAWSTWSSGFERPPPSADDGEPDVARGDAAHKAGAIRIDGNFHGGAWADSCPAFSTKFAGPPSSATMRAKVSAARPESSASAARLAPCSFGLGDARGDKHFGGQRQRHLQQPLVAALPGEKIDGVPDFDGIAGGRSQRLVHAGDQRRCPQAGAVGDLDEAGGQLRLRRGFSP